MGSAHDDTLYYAQTMSRGMNEPRKKLGDHMAKPFQTLKVRMTDSDPCTLWVRGSQLPVYRHNKPFPGLAQPGTNLDFYGNGDIVARGLEGKSKWATA